MMAPRHPERSDRSARRLLALAVILAASASMASAQQIAVKAGVTVAPDTVKVGDPFRVTVGVRAPKGASIEFPRATDSTSTVQSLDPVRVRTTADTTALEQYADYRVAAWDVGTQPIQLEDVVVRLGSAERRIPLGGHTVFVASVLPADSAQRVPKPQRDIFEAHVFPWWWWALAAALVALGLLLWWWWRRRRRQPAAAVIIDPYERAVAEFAHVERLGLVEAGERGRYVALTVEIVRDYLAARYPLTPLSLTTGELLRIVHGHHLIPVDRLTRLLNEADLIKFARRPVSSDRARELGRDARAVVDEEHESSQPAPVQEAAA